MTVEHPRLSTTSKQYDVEGKGYLTTDQQMLRNLDTDGDGKLDPTELGPLMKSHNQLRKDNKALRRNQLFLGGTTALFGIIVIITTVFAVRASKDTVVGGDGLLESKGTGQPVVTQSRGVSIVSEMRHDEFENAYECARMEDVAKMYKAFSEGSDVRILTNDSEAIGLEEDIGFDGELMTFPVYNVQGSQAAINDTHVNVGDAMFHIAPDNICNEEGVDFEQGGRRLMYDHLQGRHLQASQPTRILLVLVSTPDTNDVQAAPPAPALPVDPLLESCKEGLFHFQKMDEFTLEITLDYWLNLNNGNCVVIDKPCPDFWDPNNIAYSDCARDCLKPESAEFPCVD